MSERRGLYLIDQEIASLPAGLDRAVLGVLKFHVGRANAIGRADLLIHLNWNGFPLPDRALRAQINELRKRGQLICSAGGTEGGYWLAADRAEVEDYLNSELRARLNDLRQQEQALMKAADQIWGPPQLRLDI